MGEKSETAILTGLESLSRRSGRIPLGRAYPLAQEIIAQLKKVKGVVEAQPAGSLRRMRSTIGDLDILVAAKDSKAGDGSVHESIGRGARAGQRRNKIVD